MTTPSRSIARTATSSSSSRPTLESARAFPSSRSSRRPDRSRGRARAATRLRAPRSRRPSAQAQARVHRRPGRALGRDRLPAPGARHEIDAGRGTREGSMNVRALLAEALGTFILVLIGSFSVVSAAGVGQGNQTLVILVAPFGFGLGLLAAISIFGHVSGGYFNPAVTLGALFDGRIDIVGAIGYVIAEAIGAVAASFAVMLLVAKEAVDLTRNGPAVADEKAFAVEI